MGNTQGSAVAGNSELGHREEALSYLESLIEAEQYESDDETREHGDSEIGESNTFGNQMKFQVQSGDTRMWEYSEQAVGVSIPATYQMIAGQVQSGGLYIQKPAQRERAKDINPSQYDLPFENIVFEGGGNKGIAHCGALKYLETIGINNEKIKRVAGASVGAIMAALVAVGYSADIIEEEMRKNDMKRLFLDGCYVIRWWNLYKYYGWYQAKVFYKYFGEKLAEKAENIFRENNVTDQPEDITFEQVYKFFGKELCVVVTNLNLMTTEYCHPKTTPHMPVREAVRMSTALPVFFQPHWFKLHDDKDMFVDGGLLCNYPIHCFDGWYLSMNEEDSFAKKLQGEDDPDKLFEDRFKPRSHKTLGISIYADHEEDFLKNVLEVQFGKPEPKTPGRDTRLYKKWKETDIKREKARKFRTRRENASRAFLEILHDCDKDQNGEIDRTELNTALEDPFWETQKNLIFCKEDPYTVFDELTSKETGKIPYRYLLGKLGDPGLQIQKRFLGCERINIDDHKGFWGSLLGSVLINVKGSIVKLSDVDRTVGINTGHVETRSFDLDEEDKSFAVNRGQNRCKKFLQNFIVEENLYPRQLCGVLEG